MQIVFFWILFSLLVGMLGNSRTIGFWGAFLISLILSPFIGFIIAIISKDKEEEKRKEEMRINQQQQTQVLQQTLNKGNQQNVADELERIARLKEQGHITDEEYMKLKNKIIAKFD